MAVPLPSNKSKIRDSTQKVVDSAQPDDSVIFMWSFSPSTREAILELFHENTSVDEYIFQSYPAKHSKSQNQIMLVSAPTIFWDGSNASDIKDSIKDVHSRLDSKGIKLIIHIWIHNISRPYYLSDHGMPKTWEYLKETFDGTVEMDQVSLLFMGWEKVGLENAIEKELRIQRALLKDVEKGVMFMRLPRQDQAAAWLVLEDVIELSKAGSDRKRDIEKRIEGTNTSEEILARLTQFLQWEIDELCTKLETRKPAGGRKLYKDIQKYLANYQARIGPLFAQMNNSHEIPRKKKEVEAIVKHEYLIFRKTMWAYFEEIEKLGIEIGPWLMDFYGYKCGSGGEPPKRKKRYLERFLGLYV